MGRMSLPPEPLRTAPDGRRLIVHPGPVAGRRADAVPVQLQPLALRLAAGQPLLPALQQALPAGTASAVLRLGTARLNPLAYVMPDRSRSPAHAVYFSDRHQAPGPVQLLDGCITYGRQQGSPWLHCHARWREIGVESDPPARAARRPVRCGHLLPHEAWLAQDLPATAWCLSDAGFEVQACDETGFSLFRAVGTGTAPKGQAPARPGQALAVRLAPNEDPCRALEALCLAHGITRATVRGGVGSTVGAVFDDGRVVQPFVTELFVRDGHVRPGVDGRPAARLDVVLVDHTGGVAQGRLARGANAVLVTFELVLQPDA